MSDKCGTCGQGLGLHHTQGCHHWGQVLPSECPGLIEQALNEVLSRDNETLRARVAELEAECHRLRKDLEKCGGTREPGQTVLCACRGCLDIRAALARTPSTETTS